MSYLSYREIPQPLERRIEIASKNTELEPNCYGTAFFLAGLLPYDMVVFSCHNFIQKGLQLMEEKYGPEDNSLMVSLRNGKSNEHMIYIQTVNPFNAFQRKGESGEFEIVKDMSQVQKYLESISGVEFFGKTKWVYEYYVHPKLGPFNNWIHKKRIYHWSKEVVQSYELGWDG